MLLHKSVEYDSRVRREARALVSDGYAVTILELDPGARGYLDGFARVSVSPPSWLRRALPFQLYRLVILGSFLRALVRLGPEVVHAHDAAMLLPGMLGARLTGAQLVYDSHELATGVPYRDGRWAAFVRAVERLGAPRAAAVITVTDGIADRMQRLYGLRQRPVVIRNVCDLLPPQSSPGALRSRLGVGGAPLILHQGAPAPDRGGEQLIAAVAELRDAHLVFLGASPFAGFTQHLQAQAASAGLADRVHFLSSVPLAELLTQTADADVGVSLLQDTCDNHRLALPNKLFEYLAAGVPVVASDLPEIRRLVIQEGVGWVTDPGQPAEIARTLSVALAASRADPALRERVREVSARLTWTAERHRLASVYEGLAVGGGSSQVARPAASAESVPAGPIAPRG
jgi:glycosyltransferase involved in cell wall biosynthesis